MWLGRPASLTATIDASATGFASIHVHGAADTTTTTASTNAAANTTVGTTASTVATAACTTVTAVTTAAGVRVEARVVVRRLMGVTAGHQAQAAEGEQHGAHRQPASVDSMLNESQRVSLGGA